MEMLLDYAKKHSPYYKNYQDAQDITEFPVMTKMKYNENMDAVLCDTFRDRKDSLFRLKTSGSTGAPLLFYATGIK